MRHTHGSSGKHSGVQASCTLYVQKVTFARRASARERLGGRLRTLGVEEHLPRNLVVVCVSVRYNSAA